MQKEEILAFFKALKEHFEEPIERQFQIELTSEPHLENIPFSTEFNIEKIKYEFIGNSILIKDEFDQNWFDNEGEIDSEDEPDIRKSLLLIQLKDIVALTTEF